jgi:large subunit ribosomal protein L17
MHNRKGFNRLGRKSSHRKALHRNMVTSLIKYERIETTQAKAKEIRRTAEKMVTRAKVDSVHNRRIVAKMLYEKDVLNKLFTEVGPRFAERPGGYTRILKIGKRAGDAADMVILEFLTEEVKTAPKKKAATKKKAAPKASDSKKESNKTKEAVVTEETPIEESPVEEPKVEEPKAEEAPSQDADKPEAEEAVSKE